MKNLTKLCTIFLLLGYGCSPKWTETDKGTFKQISNEGGQTIGYSAASRVQILTVDRFAFKNLNKNGTLDPYEDWRLWIRKAIPTILLSD